MEKFDQDRQLLGHRSSIYGLTPLDDQQFLSAGGDGWVVRWPLHKGEDGQLVSKVDGQIFAICYLPDRDEIWIGDMNGGLYGIQHQSGELIFKSKQHDKGTYLIAEVKDNLISAGGDGILSIMTQGDTHPHLSVQISESHLRAVAVHPSGDIVALAGGDGGIYLFETQSWKCLEQIPNAHDNSIFDLEFHPTEDVLFSGGRDAHLKAWSWKDGTLLRDIPAHQFTVNDIAIMADRGLLLTASRDKSCRIWDLDTLDLMQVIDSSKPHHHLNSVNALTVFEGGFITAGDDRTIRIWT